MRFTVSSTALSSRLTALSRVINSKNSLPILGDFVFDVTSDGALRLSAKNQETGFTATIKETVELVEEDSKQENREREEPVLTDSLTLHQRSRYAERGYSQTNYAQEEGNIAQRGRCRSRWAVFRVAWLGRDYGGVRQNEAHVLGRSRLARHRRRSDGLLYREETTGSSGRCRTAATDKPGYGDRVGQGHRWRSGGSSDRHQFTGTVLFINTNDRRA